MCSLVQAIEFGLELVDYCILVMFFFLVGLESTEQLDECYWFSLFLLAGTKMH